jgi:tRNA threonylcarbamoyladenosine biosynthesis protein TsaB
MTLVVGFDTATDDVAVALVRARNQGSSPEVIAERSGGLEGGSRPRHATDLLPELERVVDPIGWSGVDLLAVGVGPGSFTGLRIGLATARALAQALAKPVVPAGTLAALARGLRERPEGRDRTHLAALDARRGQVFAALYGAEGEQLWPPFVAPPGELGDRVAELPAPPLTAGSGAIRFRHELESRGAQVLADADQAHRVSARHVCLLAAAGEPVRPESIQPIYLRPPDAELWLERDSH